MGFIVGQAAQRMGFKNSEYNPIYFYVTVSEFVMFPIVVNDLAPSSKYASFLRVYKSKLDSTLDVRPFGKLTNFIG